MKIFSKILLLALCIAISVGLLIFLNSVVGMPSKANESDQYNNRLSQLLSLNPNDGLRENIQEVYKSWDLIEVMSYNGCISGANRDTTLYAYLNRNVSIICHQFDDELNKSGWGQAAIDGCNNFAKYIEQVNHSDDSGPLMKKSSIWLKLEKYKAIKSNYDEARRYVNQGAPNDLHSMLSMCKQSAVYLSKPYIGKSDLAALLRDKPIRLKQSFIYLKKSQILREKSQQIPYTREYEKWEAFKDKEIDEIDNAGMHSEAAELSKVLYSE